MSLLGSAALHRQPVLNLAQACMGPSFCLAPAPAGAQPLAKRGAEGAQGLHVPLPTPVAAAQPPARVHSPQQQQDASPQQPPAAQQQWPAFGARALSPAAAVTAAAAAPSNPLLTMEAHPRLDAFDLPTLSAGSLPAELFDPSCLDFLS